MNQFFEALNLFGKWLTGHLWQVSLELTILAAGVLALVWLLRIRSPATRHLFCCLLLVKPLVMLVLASPVSPYWFLKPKAAQPAPSPAAHAAAVRPDARPRPVAYPRTAGYSDARPTGASRVGPTAPTPVSLDLHGAAALAWILIASAMSVRLIVGFAYVSFLRHSARVRDCGPEAKALAEASDMLRLRSKVDVAVSDVAHGPVLAGVLRPMILLPRRLAEALSPNQLRLVIAHELAHVRRRDNLVLLAQRVAETLLFFHPVVWACGWVMRREAEAACDDVVTAASGQFADYADSLTRVAEIRSPLTRRLLVNTFAAAESSFSRRVRRILHGPAGRATLAVSVASVVAMVVVGCLGLPTAADRRPEKVGQLLSRKGDTFMSDHASSSSQDQALEIPGVPILAWGRSGDTTFAGAMEAALKVTEHPSTYAQLMGYSGLAFRVRWGPREKGWCPSVAVGEFPEEIEAVSRATGWVIVGRENMANESDPHMERYAPEMKASIDVGRPVVGYGQNMDVGVCYGYEDGGRTFLWRDYHQGESTVRLPVEKTGPMLLFLDRYVEPPSDRDRLLQSIRIAVGNWRRKAQPRAEGYYYLYGQDALEAWRRDLADHDSFDTEQCKSLLFVNWWNFEAFADAREQAAKFLKELAPALEGDAREAVEQAAAVYGREAEMLAGAFREKNAFLGPWTGKKPSDWTPEVRQREQQILGEALTLEAEAIAALEWALSLEGIEPWIAGTPNAQQRKGKVLKDVMDTYLRLEKSMPSMNHIRTNLLVRAALMQAAGRRQSTYEELVAVSGFGTCFAYHPKKFWVMYMWPDEPQQTEPLLARATGLSWRNLGKPGSPEEAWKATKQHIDAGKGVQGNYMDDLVFAGYREASEPSQREICVIGGWDAPGWWTWDRFVEWYNQFGQCGAVAEACEAAPPREIALEVMARTVAHADIGKVTGGPVDGAVFGLAGIEAYAADVENVSKSPDTFDAGWLGCHCINRQISGRDAAAGYFAKTAELFRGVTAESVRTAAAEYRAAREAWRDFERQLGHLADKGTEAEQLAPLWRSEDARRAGAAAIRKAARHEAAAVEALRQALAARKVVAAGNP